ncbi:MAG: hypothetical protein M1812_005099 [Candelaria pacifica]|nr:MAG: hypothetical protein M1812_005099 [Candelaria pacifica]
MACSISNLPAEVTHSIVKQLDHISLCSVRLTCKDLERKSLYQFRDTFFTTREMDLGPTSLRRLQAISESEQYRSHVRALSIVRPEGKEIGEGFHWPRITGSDDTSYIDTQHSVGVQVLRDVLNNLGNCRSFRIHDLLCHDGLLEPYLVASRIHDLLIQTDRLGPYYLAASDAIGVLLDVVIKANLSVDSLDIDFDNSVVDGKRLRTQLFKQPTFPTRWANLKHLRIKSYITPENHDWIRDVLYHATGLEKLTMLFNLQLCPQLTSDYLDHSPNVIEGLRELELGGIKASEDLILALLQKCRKNLRSLTLRLVSLIDGAWARILMELMTFRLLENVTVNHLGGSIGEEIHWAQFPGLETNPMVPGSNGQSFKLDYYPSRTWDDVVVQRVRGASFQGRVNMNKALEYLVQSKGKDQ